MQNKLLFIHLSWRWSNHNQQIHLKLQNFTLNQSLNPTKSTVVYKFSLDLHFYHQISSQMLELLGQFFNRVDLELLKRWNAKGMCRIETPLLQQFLHSLRMEQMDFVLSTAKSMKLLFLWCKIVLQSHLFHYLNNVATIAASAYIFSLESSIKGLQADNLRKGKLREPFQRITFGLVQHSSCLEMQKSSKKFLILLLVCDLGHLMLAQIFLHVFKFKIFASRWDIC